SVVEQVDDQASVDGISGEAIGMPGNYTVGLSSFNSFYHFVKNRPAWSFCAPRLFKRFNNSDFGPLEKELFQFAFLGFYRKHLAILILRGFSAINKILHDESFRLLKNDLFGGRL